MDDLKEFGPFIAGFVSGEGCFYIYFAKSVSPLPVVVCAFSIKLRADDYDLLRSIWVALDYPGRIYRIPTKRYEYAWDSVQRHDAVMLKVTSLKELTTRIIPFFERHPLRGKKRRSFDLWQQAVLMLHNREHLSLQGIDRLWQLQKEMNQYQGQDAEFPSDAADATVDQETPVGSDQSNNANDTLSGNQ